jgi:hypothetical protein
MTLAYYIKHAFMVGVSTVYGFGEMNCGDIGKAVPCDANAITASGIPFDPEMPYAAVAAPTELRMEPKLVFMRVADGPCIPIWILDKMNPRYIGERGFDLSPRALELLTGNRSPQWSGRVSKCTGDINETFYLGSFNAASDLSNGPAVRKSHSRICGINQRKVHASQSAAARPSNRHHVCD